MPDVQVLRMLDAVGAGKTDASSRGADATSRGAASKPDASSRGADGTDASSRGADGTDASSRGAAPAVLNTRPPALASTESVREAGAFDAGGGGWGRGGAAREKSGQTAAQTAGSPGYKPFDFGARQARQGRRGGGLLGLGGGGGGGDGSALGEETGTLASAIELKASCTRS